MICDPGIFRRLSGAALCEHAEVVEAAGCAGVTREAPAEPPGRNGGLRTDHPIFLLIRWINTRVLKSER